MPTRKGNVLTPLLAAVAVLALIIAGYFYVQTHLFSTPTPISSAKDETANWKIYTNSEGYSIKYPQNWSEPTENINKSDISTENSADFGGIILIISGLYQRAGFSKPSNLDEYMNVFLYQANYDIQKFRDYSLNGITGKVYTDPEASDKTRIYLPFPKNNPKIITIIYKNTSNKLLIDQILSTFKFL